MRVEAGVVAGRGQRSGDRIEGRLRAEALQDLEAAGVRVELVQEGEVRE